MSDIIWQVNGVVIGASSPDQDEKVIEYVCPANPTFDGSISLGTVPDSPVVGQRILVTVAWADTPLGIPGENP